MHKSKAPFFSTMADRPLKLQALDDLASIHSCTLTPIPDPVGDDLTTVQSELEVLRAKIVALQAEQRSVSLAPKPLPKIEAELRAQVAAHAAALRWPLDPKVPASVLVCWPFGNQIVTKRLDELASATAPGAIAADKRAAMLAGIAEEIFDLETKEEGAVRWLRAQGLAVVESQIASRRVVLSRCQTEAAYASGRVI
jgi:hypothetical protein